MSSHRPNSSQLFERAQRTTPGGVNSPVRAFKAVGGTPVFFTRAKGAWLTDVDGNQYIDYIGSWGPMILGHAYPPVLAAIAEAAQHSTSFGAPTEREIQLAELICEMVPGVEKVRMVNSGTEATMSALRLARGVTGRAKLIKFVGCYHGHGDSFLVKAGSGVATLGIPGTPGVTPGTAADTLTAPFNDLTAVEMLVAEHGADLAAIIVEPVAGNMGCIPPVPGFLEGLRALCDQTGALLIFDEVMTGFRLSAAGAAGLYGIQPDLYTFGKVIGGGLPVGAYAGPTEIMDQLAPVGPVYQAGTLSGNPLAMAAGQAMLQTLHTQSEIYSQLALATERLHQGMAQVLDKQGIHYRINRLGSMISLHFADHAIVDFDSVQAGNLAAFNRLFHLMLDRGVYLPPAAYESWFVSTCHTPDLIDRTVDALADSLPVLLAEGVLIQQ